MGNKPLFPFSITKAGDLTMSRIGNKNLSEIYDPLKCVFCNYIPSNPLVFNCCEKFTCSDCYSKDAGADEEKKVKDSGQTYIPSYYPVHTEKKDLMKSLTCPGCGSGKPHFIVTFLNKLQEKIFSSLIISCKFEKCKETGTLYEIISEHEDYCEYNPDRLDKCKRCQATFPYKDNSKHDCVSYLLKKVEELNNTLAEVQSKKEKKIELKPELDKTDFSL
jgi:hypothetical protein